jgi:N utilization substance protein A
VLLAADQNVLLHDDELLAALSGSTPAVTVVSGVISEAGPDVALVRLRDGRTGRLPVTEFHPNRRWETGRTYFLAACDDSSRPLLSATRPELVGLVLAGLVPELRDGRVRILRTARQVGIRSKVAVAPTVEGVDAVGALIGRAACRLKAASAMLTGERIDVVSFNPDRARFVVNALAVKPLSCTVTDTGAVEVAVPQHQLASALGGGGLNVSLAARLTGARILVHPA